MEGKLFGRLRRWIEQTFSAAFFNSVHANLIFYFIIVLIIPLFSLAIITYSISAQTITNKTQNYVEQIVIKVKENIEYYFRDLQSLSHVISINNDILSALRSGPVVDTWKEIGYQNKIKNFLAELTSTRTEIKGIYIVSSDGKRHYSSGPPVFLEELNKQEWYKQIKTSKARFTVTGIHFSDYTGGLFTTPVEVVTYVQHLTDLDGQRLLGWLLIDLDYSFVTKMLENIELWDEGRVYILDAKGDIIYGDSADRYQAQNLPEVYLRDKGSFVKSWEGKKELVIFQTASLCHWKVIFAIPYNILQKENIFIRNYTLILTVILFTIAVYLAVLFSKKVSGPITLLCSSMREVEKGNLDITVKIWSMNEFNLLADSFNRMVKQIRVLMNNIYEGQKKRREAELNALQAQINPHFLYNTLDSLRWLAKIHHIQEISDIISALENLLRASISGKEDLIPIIQEFENVRNYLAIQLFRYGNNFTVEYHMDPSLKDYLTPRLILQPIVENAIYHGVAKVVNGEIKISIYSEEETVCFEVVDNGPGIDEERIRLIMAGKIKNLHRFSGLGIKNVDERIKLYFGERYGVQIENHQPRGTRVIIRIPRRHKFERKIRPWLK